MNAGEQVLDFLYSTQLQVDDEWAVRTPLGFTWWAAGNAQSVEIIGEESGPENMTGQLLSVRTEMLSDIELTDDMLHALNDGPMRFAAMSGPVYFADTQTLSLCSLALVHDEIASWMGMLLSTTAILQLAETHFYGEQIAEKLNAHEAITGHPDRGVRQEPDEMTRAASQIFSPANREPLRLNESDFDEAVREFMTQPPAVAASAGGLGLTVEFPYGDGSSLCQFFGDQDHPLFGNGLLVVQRFPHHVETEADGIRLALEFNRADLTGSPAGYGLGSYVYVDGILCFNAFIPNLLLRDGVLPTLYFSCAARAFAMSMRLLGQGWDENSFTPGHSASAKLLDVGDLDKPQ